MEDEVLTTPIRRLLREHGLPAPPSPARALHFDEPHCCAPLVHDFKEAHVACTQCGRIVDTNMLFMWPYYKACVYIDHATTHYFQPKRYYSCRQNFRTYLNQYSGGGPVYVEDDYLVSLKEQLDVKDPDAYLKARLFIKKCKNKKASRHYKSLWRFLYDIGGQRPQLKNVDQIMVEIQAFQQFFYDQKDTMTGHNVTGTWQILRHIMIMCHHTPYYNFPTLLNKEKQERVENLITNYRAYIADKRQYDSAQLHHGRV